MIQRTDIDRGLSEALANEEQIDVSMIPDISVMALPLQVKHNCLIISERLGETHPEALLRLKRVVKMRGAMQSL